MNAGSVSSCIRWQSIWISNFYQWISWYCTCRSLDNSELNLINWHQFLSKFLKGCLNGIFGPLVINPPMCAYVSTAAWSFLFDMILILQSTFLIKYSELCNSLLRTLLDCVPCFSIPALALRWDEKYCCLLLLEEHLLYALPCDTLLVAVHSHVRQFIVLYDPHFTRTALCFCSPYHLLPEPHVLILSLWSLQMFHLMPTPQGSFYVLNDIFRLNYAWDEQDQSSELKEQKYRWGYSPQFLCNLRHTPSRQTPLMYIHSHSHWNVVWKSRKGVRIKSI